MDHNLVIDVGMHDGTDTAHYLGLGYNVVAIEANPLLVSAAQARFHDELGSGQLRILPVAVAESDGHCQLGIAEDNSEWSSLVAHFRERNVRAGRTTYRYVDVPARNFANVLCEVGVPYYLKVDIEGLDMLCIEALSTFTERPRFISLESSATSPGGTAATLFRELATLYELGYRRFAWVDQSKLTPHSSGPFGDDLPVPWLDAGEAMRAGLRILHDYDLAGFGGRWTPTSPGNEVPGVRTLLDSLCARIMLAVFHGGMFPWFDLHAAM